MQLTARATRNEVEEVGRTVDYPEDPVGWIVASFSRKVKQSTGWTRVNQTSRLLHVDVSEGIQTSIQKYIRWNDRWTTVGEWESRDQKNQSTTWNLFMENQSTTCWSSRLLWVSSWKYSRLHFVWHNSPTRKFKPIRESLAINAPTAPWWVGEELKTHIHHLGEEKHKNWLPNSRERSSQRKSLFFHLCAQIFAHL